MRKISLNVIFLLSLFAFFALVSNVFAATTGVGISKTTGSGGDMQMVLCNVLRFVTGGIGKTIASFIIIGVGLGFFTGKVSWGVLIGVTLGISAMFGAPAIVAAITGGSSELCSDSNG